MIKPTPTREVAVRSYDPVMRRISIDASNDAIEDFREFGKVYPMAGETVNLWVDARYIFDEVLEYIESYG